MITLTKKETRQFIEDELTSILLKINPALKKKFVKKGIKKAGKILLSNAHIKKIKKEEKRLSETSLA